MRITPGQRIDWINKHIVNPRTNEPICLAPFQIQFIENVYAQGILSAGFSLPRKNGKTGLLAALALCELDLNRDADIVLGATKVKQASRPSGIFGVMKTYVRLGGLDHLRVSRNNNDPTIKNLNTGGQAEAVSFWDNDAAQGLNPSLCILDEFGTEFWTPERWGAAVLSMGGRDDARVIGISTPSSQLSAMYDLRSKHESGVTADSFYWQEHSAPLDLDIYDPKTWEIANPALGSFLSVDSFEQDKSLPETLFRLFRLGQWVESDLSECWLGDSAGLAWDAIEAQYEFELGAPTWVGVDYAKQNDTCAVVYGQQKPDGSHHFKCKIGKPTEYNSIDLNQLGYFLRELDNKYKLVSIYYDPYGMQFLAEHLENEGLPMVVYKQSEALMVPAVMNCRSAIYDQSFTHDADDNWRTQILNAKPHYYGTTGFSLEKRKAGGKIDSAVALCLAHTAAINEPAVRDYRIFAL